MTLIRDSISSTIFVIISDSNNISQHSLHHSVNSPFQKESLRIAKRLQPANAPFNAHSTLLVSTKWKSGIQLEMSVDPNVAGLKLARDFVGTFYAARPHRSP